MVQGAKLWLAPRRRGGRAGGTAGGARQHAHAYCDKLPTGLALRALRRSSLHGTWLGGAPGREGVVRLVRHSLCKGRPPLAQDALQEQRHRGGGGGGGHQASDDPATEKGEVGGGEGSGDSAATMASAAAATNGERAARDTSGGGGGGGDEPGAAALRTAHLTSRMFSPLPPAAFQGGKKGLHSEGTCGPGGGGGDRKWNAVCVGGCLAGLKAQSLHAANAGGGTGTGSGGWHTTPPLD